MAEYRVVEKDWLDQMANVIRSKTGSDELMPREAFIPAIEGISGGGMAIPTDFGLSKMWMGSLAIDTPTALPTITHGLGEVPKVFVMWLNDNWGGAVLPGQTNEVFMLFAINPSQNSSNEIMTAGKLINNNGNPNFRFRNTYDGKIWTYADRIALHNNSTSIFSGSYNIIAMA